MYWLYYNFIDNIQVIPINKEVHQHTIVSLSITFLSSYNSKIRVQKRMLILEVFGSSEVYILNNGAKKQHIYLVSRVFYRRRDKNYKAVACFLLSNCLQTRKK